MLSIKNLHAEYDHHSILQGIDLQVRPGEVHAIMGPNGSGKSTLGSVLAGREDFSVTQGSIEFLGENILPLDPEQRAVRGMFLGFQYPVEIPGVNNMYFLKTAVNSLRRQRGEPLLDAFDFLNIVKAKMAVVAMDEKFLHRSVNAGFSGGEKKRNEILQLLMLEPKLAILDEPDSGLDIDALQVVAEGINDWRAQHPQSGLILVTHYQRLLHYVIPDYVHVLSAGKMIRSGDHTLALELEAKGYSWLIHD